MPQSVYERRVTAGNTVMILTVAANGNKSVQITKPLAIGTHIWFNSETNKPVSKELDAKLEQLYQANEAVDWVVD